MKAWQFTNTHEPLVLNEVPEPTAGPDDVVIDIKAAGLCHSDVGLLEDEGWLPMLGPRPLTPGHEIAGVISAVGEDVEGWKVGDRVGVCPSEEGATSPGYTHDGGYSFKCAASAKSLVAVPESLSFEQAAAGTDAGMTSYHAVVTAGGVKEGDRVGIIGLGGLGQIGARIAVLRGCEVHVAEPNKQVWPLGEEIGVTRIVSDVTEFAGENLDVIIDFAGFGTTTAGAIEAVRPGGTVVQVGLGRMEATINTTALVTRRITLIGSLGGSVEDIKGVYDMLASGELNPTLTSITFNEIPEGLDRLSKGDVVGRLVATYDA
ncbi:zinc-binding dehydrogenase [Streptomyces sp. GQFP]|uniref:zinc-binding dehydrogenase n=1 Tax=Streptomyces sp. GQFP TaxID=2907545 RepID=UPI001F1FC7DF|nr:zinc-binding dehydrogenase [Streptomyces sp. GQFP]UIX29322.1 zinc-binding dehydrogenase [Streptomyces sp. GQFP]